MKNAMEQNDNDRAGGPTLNRVGKGRKLCPGGEPIRFSRKKGTMPVEDLPMGIGVDSDGNFYGLNEQGRKVYPTLSGRVMNIWTNFLPFILSVKDLGGDASDTAPFIKISAQNGELILDEMHEDAPISTVCEKTGANVRRTTDNREQLYARLKILVADPINALPEVARRVRGRVRTGEEVVQAIPDVEAFLNEVAQMREGIFLELNEVGQLVMQDGCKKVYGLNEDFPTAQIRQKRLVYRDATGKVQTLSGVNFTTDGGTGELILPNSNERIPADAVLMEKGLPALDEYTRMHHKRRLDRENSVWIEDSTITDASTARFAYWAPSFEQIRSLKGSSDVSNKYCGSLGILKVNLNFTV